MERKVAEEQAEERRKKREEGVRSGKYRGMAATSQATDKCVMDSLMQEIRMGFNLQSKMPTRRDSFLKELESNLPDVEGSSVPLSYTASDTSDQVPSPLKSTPTAPISYARLNIPASTICNTNLAKEGQKESLECDDDEHSLVPPSLLPPPSPLIMDALAQGEDIDDAATASDTIPFLPLKKRNSMTLLLQQESLEIPQSFDSLKAEDGAEGKTMDSDYHDGNRSKGTKDKSRKKKTKPSSRKGVSLDRAKNKSKQDQCTDADDEGIVFLRRSKSMERVAQPTLSLDRDPLRAPSLSASAPTAAFKEAFHSMKSSIPQDRDIDLRQPTELLKRPGSTPVREDSPPVPVVTQRKKRSSGSGSKSPGRHTPPFMSSVTTRLFSVFRRRSSVSQDPGTQEFTDVSPQEQHSVLYATDLPSSPKRLVASAPKRAWHATDV